MARIKESAVYILTGPNGKQYVGASIDVHHRLNSHRTGGCSATRDFIKEFGWENIKKEIIPVKPEQLDAYERFYINICNCIKPNGYNLESGGKKGNKVHTETKEKMSKAKRGVPIGPATGLNAKGVPKGPATGLNAKRVPKGPATGKAATGVQVECPHCGKTGGTAIMGRWHFDNCKFKEE